MTWPGISKGHSRLEITQIRKEVIELASILNILQLTLIYFYIVRDDAPSFCSSCRCAGLGVLVQGRYGDTFGGIRGRYWGGVVGFGDGCAAIAEGIYFAQ